MDSDLRLLLLNHYFHSNYQVDIVEICADTYQYKFISNRLTIPDHAATSRPLFWSVQEEGRGRT